MRNRASRRLWGTYEHGWIWCADNVKSEKLWNWLENDNAELFVEFSPEMLSEVHLAYLALVTYSKNILHGASELEIVLKYVSGRFGMPLNISIFIRYQGETMSHKWITRDGPSFAYFTAKKAVGAVVDINWENLTMSKHEIDDRNVLSKRPEEKVELARTDLQLWNDLVLDAGVKIGLRCGGEHFLVAGVAIVNEEVASDVGEKWKESLGHTEMPAGTTRLGSTVCVG